MLLVADSKNHRIRRVDLALGQVATLAGDGLAGFDDGPAAWARFDTPFGIAAMAGGIVLVADQKNHRIRAIQGGVVKTFAGKGTAAWVDGPLEEACFNNPTGVAVDGSGKVYVADQGNHRVRVIDGGVVSTFAGSTNPGMIDGQVSIALFNQPTGVAVAGGKVYVADQGNHRIRAVQAGVVKTLAGSGAPTPGFLDGPVALARFSSPAGVALHPSGKILVGDEGNNRIRVIAP